MLLLLMLLFVAKLILCLGFGTVPVRLFHNVLLPLNINSEFQVRTSRQFMFSAQSQTVARRGREIMTSTKLNQLSMSRGTFAERGLKSLEVPMYPYPESFLPYVHTRYVNPLHTFWY